MTTIAWMDIALIGSALISWLAVAIALFCMRRVRAQTTLTQKLYERLSHDLQVANSGSIGMGQRLIAMERKLQSTAARQSQMAEQESAYQPYTQATRMFSAGAPAEEVASRCGLSRAEASLMQVMHQQMKGAVAA